MSGAFEVGGLTITYNRLWIVVFALAVFAVLLRGDCGWTRFGLQMRAVTQNRRMATSMGIRTPWVDAFTFALGSGIAGIAGVALSQIDNVRPNLGQGYIIDSFMVVVFGGVGNLWGTLVGAFTLGIVNKFLEPYAGAVLGKILVLVFIILFIQKRPRGLFALKGRAVEILMAVVPARGRSAASALPIVASSSWRPRSSVPVLHLLTAADASAACADLRRRAVRQVSLLRAARRRARPRLGLLRHPLARPRRLLRARRLRHGHVPDAPDRLARRLRQSGPAGLHGVPELAGAALVLVRLRQLLASPR